MEARARLLAESIRAFATDLQAAGGDAVDPALVVLLAAPLARLTKMIIPNVHQKIDEIVYADEQCGKLRVSREQHGHDLSDEQGGHFELKVSVCSKRGGRCNFNWPVPKADGTIAGRRAKLVESVKEKTRGGHAVLQVKDGLQRKIAEYKLTEPFLVAYFERLPLGKADKHNMACEQCHTCGGFHRMDKLQAASDAMAARKAVEWRSFFNTMPSQC
jgi:hypothetical protein